MRLVLDFGWAALRLGCQPVAGLLQGKIGASGSEDAEDTINFRPHLTIFSLAT